MTSYVLPSLVSSPEALAGGGGLLHVSVTEAPGTLQNAARLNRPVVSAAGHLIGFLSIEENDILLGRWVGYCTPETVVTGMETALQLLTAHPCRGIISDGSMAMGDWSELVAWMQYDMLPRVVSSGVRYIANVRSPDPASRLAHQAYARVAAQIVTIRLFDDPRLARQWLREMLAAS